MNTLMRFLLTALLATFAVFADARPEFLALFTKHYKIAPNSTLGGASCGICHTSPPTRNPYGKTLQTLIKASGGRDLTENMLVQAENLDSDGDGWTNGDEIRKDTLPGDPDSHPAGKAPPLPPVNSTSGPSSPTDSPIIPTHAFHPALVHFPIALFLFGAFLELVGIWKGNKALGSAALFNLIGALISMVVVVPTGVGAWLLGKHELKGTMLIHLLLAITSLALMGLTLYLRKTLGNDKKGYWAVLIIGAIAIGATGYFGGELVFG